MKTIYYTVWIFFLTIVQTTILDYIKIINIKPNIFIIFIITTALLKGTVDGGIIGLILGFIMDFTGGRVPGVYTLMFLYIGILSGLIFKNFLKNKYFVIITVVFGASIFYGFLFYFTNFMIWGKGDLVYAFSSIILPETLYNTVICLPLHMLIKKTERCKP